METYNEHPKPLERKQKHFCDEYLKDLNATAAAKRAGYSVKNAHNTGCRILATPQAKDYIKKQMALLEEQTAM